MTSAPEFKKRKIRFVDWFYFLFDYVFKVISEGVIDCYQFIQRVLAVLMARVFIAISVFFVSPFTKDRSVTYKVFVGIPKVLIGLILLTFLCLVTLVVFLFGGTLASLTGFRNIADYSFKEQIAAWAVFMLVWFWLPFHLTDYWTFKVALVFCHILIIVGFNFLYGQCGILSLGHAGFVFWGSYMTAFLYTGSFGFKLPFFISMLLASLSSFVIGLGLGLPSLRVKDYYLVIITLAFTISLPQILRSRHMAEYSGLSSGGISITQIAPPEFLASCMSQAVWNYFFVGTITFALIIFVYNIWHHSQVGRAFRTIRCDTEVSIIMGIPVVRYKLLAFAMSALYASIAGSLVMYLNQFIAPDSYTVNDSIDYIVASVVGGPASILGCSVGGIFLAFEKELASAMAHVVFRGNHLTRMFYGILMIFIVFVAPRGIVGEATKKLKSALIRRPKRGAYYLAPPPDFDFLDMKSTVTTIKDD